MPGKGTIDPIFILRQVQEKISKGNRKRYWASVDLEKASDWVPREVLYWNLQKKGITEKLVRVIQSMCMMEQQQCEQEKGIQQLLKYLLVYTKALV